MKLENQVCSLELAKKLKELGVNQESLFYWERQYLPQVTTDWRIMLGHQYNEYISAFTVAELGEMLPYYHYETIKSFRWVDFACECFEISFKCKTEADARANMVIYLIENKLI